jgi:hypothetical protein
MPRHPRRHPRRWCPRPPHSLEPGPRREAPPTQLARARLPLERAGGRACQHVWLARRTRRHPGLHRAAVGRTERIARARRGHTPAPPLDRAERRLRQRSDRRRHAEDARATKRPVPAVPHGTPRGGVPGQGSG